MYQHNYYFTSSYYNLPLRYFNSIAAIICVRYSKHILITAPFQMSQGGLPYTKLFVILMSNKQYTKLILVRERQNHGIDAIQKLYVACLLI